MEMVSKYGNFANPGQLDRSSAPRHGYTSNRHIFRVTGHASAPPLRSREQ